MKIDGGQSMSPGHGKCPGRISTILHTGESRSAACRSRHSWSPHASCLIGAPRHRISCRKDLGDIRSSRRVISELDGQGILTGWVLWTPSIDASLPNSDVVLLLKSRLLVLARHAGSVSAVR